MIGGFTRHFTLLFFYTNYTKLYKIYTWLFKLLYLFSKKEQQWRRGAPLLSRRAVRAHGRVMRGDKERITFDNTYYTHCTTGTPPTSQYVFLVRLFRYSDHSRAILPPLWPVSIPTMSPSPSPALLTEASVVLELETVLKIARAMCVSGPGVPPPPRGPV